MRINNGIIYLISNALNAGVPFLMLPILTRTLTQTEYGEVAIFQTCILALAGVIGLSSHGAATRRFYDEITKKELVTYNNACFLILIISFGIVITVVSLFNRNISDLLGIEASWVYLAVVVSSMNFIILFRLSQYHIRFNAVKFGLIQVSLSILNMALSLIFVLSFELGAEGRVYGLLLANVIFSIVSLFLLFQDDILKLKSGTKISDLLDIIKYGVPLMPHIIGFFFLSAFDRLIINQYLGSDYAGIYMLAVQVTMVLPLVFDAFNKSFVTWLYEGLSKNNDTFNYKLVNVTYKLMFLLILMMPICYFISPLVVDVIAGDGYEEAGNIVGLICVGQIFGGMYLLFCNYIFYAKKTAALSLITISTGGLHIILSIYIIEDYGLTGVAMSYAVSKFMQFISTLFFVY